MWGGTDRQGDVDREGEKGERRGGCEIEDVGKSGREKERYIKDARSRQM